jgi:hypothetical protein
MSRLLFASLLAVAVIGGLLAGGAWAWVRAKQTPGGAQIIRNGVWWTSEAVGSADQSLALRAFVARTGILGLGQSEVIYFQTTVDDEGRALSTKCDYEISGGSMGAQWWSVTVYDETNHYFPIEKVPASYNARNLPTGPDGSWRFEVGVAPREGAWIPVLDTGQMNLLVRLYRPTQAVRKNLTAVSLPHVRRIKCA